MCSYKEHNEKLVIQTVVPTGMATLQFKDSKTIHSFFQINPYEKSPYLEKIAETSLSRTAHMLKILDILIIDEISMVSNKLFLIMHEMLKRAKENCEPFGGVKVIIFGDFKQLGPVNDGSEFFYGNKKYILFFLQRTKSTYSISTSPFKIVLLLKRYNIILW